MHSMHLCMRHYEITMKKYKNLTLLFYIIQVSREFFMYVCTMHGYACIIMHIPPSLVYSDASKRARFLAVFRHKLTLQEAWSRKDK